MNAFGFSIIEENVSAYYRSITDSLDGQFFEQEQIAWFTSGRRSLMRFNGVLRFHAPAQELHKIAKPVLEHFLINDLPFFWADYPPGTTPGLGQYLSSLGVQLAATDMPAMQRGLDDLPAQRLPETLEIVPVRTEQDQLEWLEVLMRGFPEPEGAREDLQQFLHHSLCQLPSRWRHFLGRWQGEPCAISSLLCASLAGGIYHVVTLPAYRGRGLAKALTREAMRVAREIGFNSAVLFATPDGYPLYQKLGFKTVMTADLYGWNGG